MSSNKVVDALHKQDDRDGDDDEVIDDDGDDMEDDGDGDDDDDDDDGQKNPDEEEDDPITTKQQVVLADQMPKKKNDRISAAIYKTKMLAEFLQDPDRRIVIWSMIELMMQRRGYMWVQDRPAPDRLAYLLPTNKNFLYIYHKHAERDGCEPVYVLFFSKLGDPNLKTFSYPSRHVIIVSDTITGKAKTAISEAPNQSNYRWIQPAQKSTTLVRHSDLTILKSNMFPLKDVYIESFPSNMLTFDILNTHYLRTMQQRLLTNPDDSKIAMDFAGGHDLERLPHMTNIDPIALYFGWKPGTLIEETHLSANAGYVKSWRSVVRAKPSNRVALVNFVESNN